VATKYTRSGLFPPLFGRSPWTTIVLVATAETIRDVLGLVRLLYATRVADGVGVDGLVPIGKDLRVALDLAKYEEGSLGHRASLDRAERALDALARQVDGGPLVDLVHRARLRLRGLS
jgi:hypothetical protein